MTKKDKTFIICGLILNVLFIPGIGTLIGSINSNKKQKREYLKHGIIQLTLSIVSIPLMLIYIGFLTLIFSWVWALNSSIIQLKDNKS
ncbi:MAG: hypothetical protein COT55_01200 [Candidatus Diapherotrites archaeon CG09_land_8_20_14_0_10_32_12]|nr:MAG: hypothetical protein COT55_01200 [Candidatus Diapherotrites archaeon CG09_land_8_20_14_0_10_32_12]